MSHHITILHSRPAVGETLAWSLRFASGYSATYVNDGAETQTTRVNTSILLTDYINLERLSQSAPIYHCPVMLLIDDIQDTKALDVINTGLAGIIDLSRGPQSLIEKVNQVLENRSDEQHVLLQQLLHQKNGGPKKADDDYHLTVKEKQVLKQLREGVHLKKIAHTTGTSYETVRTHVKHIYRKLGVMSISEAVIKAMKMDLE
ncbi:helix-turn-helix transcriptional regulator [Flavitalea antarctica]